MPTTFGALGVPDDLVAPAARAGIAAPFPIQEAVIPDALAGRDVTGRAPTGSGKTLAFGIPLVAGLRPAQRRRPTAPRAGPDPGAGRADRRRAAPAGPRPQPPRRGGVRRGRLRAQRKALDAGAELVVACPGRLEDLIRWVPSASTTSRRSSSTRPIGCPTWASSRPCGGSSPRRPRDRQVLLFSATLDGAVGTLAAAVQRQPIRHEVGPAGPDMALTRHAFWSVDRTVRPELTAGVVSELGSTMVFCRTRHGADRLARQLAKLGVEAAPIHGGRSQPQRDRALKAFQTGAVTALVATDVAARGVHVDDVAAVVHFDPPADAATYVHRSGRTARAGASGVVVSFVEHGTDREAVKLQRDIGIDVPVGRPDVPALSRRPAPRRTAEPVAPVSPVAPTVAPVSPVAPIGAHRTKGTVAFFHMRRGLRLHRRPRGRQGPVRASAQHDRADHHRTGGRVRRARGRPGPRGLRRHRRLIAPRPHTT